MSFNTNNYTLSQRCPDPTTTDCIQWVGNPVPCLNVCTGDNLTTLQCQILNTLCSLVGTTDMTTIVLPSCFTNAWGTTNPDILNFLQFILDQSCLQQQSIDDIISGAIQIQNLNPILTISYPQCCQPGACNSGTTVTISQHLTNILNCLCNIYTLLGTLPTQFSTFGCAIGTLNQNITNLYNGISGQNSVIQQIVTILNSQGNNIPTTGLNLIPQGLSC